MDFWNKKTMPKNMTRCAREESKNKKKMPPEESNSDGKLTDRTRHLLQVSAMYLKHGARLHENIWNQELSFPQCHMFFSLR